MPPIGLFLEQIFTSVNFFLIIIWNHLYILAMLLFGHFLRILPHLSDTVRVLMMDRQLNVGMLLNEQDRIVEMISKQTDTQRRVVVNIDSF